MSRRISSEFGHKITNRITRQTFSNQQPGLSFQDVTCYTCSSMGHLARQCSTKDKHKNQISSIPKKVYLVMSEETVHPNMNHNNQSVRLPILMVKQQSKDMPALTGCNWL
ncbi:hypothetical protein PR048_005601 [Dryococelus australis]|uniref:CCHC-type domain-containing protein n=1 Tax=Dryococelus australis TaxID=614101 RepID=A0ABQ9I9V1_9NEOP|nr:hypothetical protein PR048_005601 [Dryococelus australis]